MSIYLTNKINNLHNLLLEIKKILTEFEAIQSFIRKYNNLLTNFSFDSLIKIEIASLYKTLRHENSSISIFFIKKGLAFFLDDLQDTSIDQINDDNEQLNKENIGKRISLLVSHYQNLQAAFKTLLETIKNKTKRFLVFSNEEILDILARISTPKVNSSNP